MDKTMEEKESTGKMKYPRRLVKLVDFEGLESPDRNRYDLRPIVRGYYDMQLLRIQCGNRLVGNFKARLGCAVGQKIVPGKSEEEGLTKEAKELIEKLRASHKKITDGVTRRSSLIKNFKGDGLITDYAAYALTSQYLAFEKEEEELRFHMEHLVHCHPLWAGFLEGVRGVGPSMAGVIITTFDIYKAKYPSSFFAYAGIDVGPDGMGRNITNPDHLVDREYINKEGKLATKASITYHPWLKTKLLGVLGAIFIKMKNSYATDHYYPYKAKLQARREEIAKREGEDAAKKEWPDGRIHKASVRYMIKMFLIDLFVNWKKIEGLPVPLPYHMRKANTIPHEDCGPERTKSELIRNIAAKEMKQAA